MASTNNYVVDLQEEDRAIEKIGGKALNLCKMSSAGFKVPYAFVVSVDAYDYFIKKELESEISQILNSIDFNSERSIARGCSSIKDIITSGTLPPNLREEIQQKIEDLPPGYYAVRSSAVAEDLPDASFAGQLDSFLNTAREDILERVVDCWASYWNDRAVKYRHDSSIGHLGTELAAAGIAVVVQRMVNADISGVMFTANPVNGSNDIVIESTWGLGEAIVSGIVSPDSFVLGREGNLLEKNIQPKDQGYFLKNGENRLIPIPVEKQKKSSLNTEILKKLLAKGVELEEFFGVPQDIEWALECGEKEAQIYILQSRPVTTLTGEGDDILWTRAYGDEYWADATTPLFYDVMGKMLTDYSEP
jgi:pyruvate,water dikinase